jgi:sulfide:quinone oxidoreductase
MSPSERPAPSGAAPAEPRPRVLIAGGGFAAVEALLALRALAGQELEVEVISLHRRFAYRPAATAEPFTGAPALGYDLSAIAADVGAAHRVDRVDAIAPVTRSVRLGSGDRIGYDALILAVGAQLRTSVPGALMFTGQRDVPHITALLDELARGEVHRVVYAVPGGISWPLPTYELALLTAGRADESWWPDVDVSIVSPEPEPLAAFGPGASALVGHLLRERGVRFVGGSTPVRHEGHLHLRSGSPVNADRVIAAPTMVGRRLPGIPGDRHGFVPTDARGRVEGLQDVYAAGDMTADPLKHGGLATLQADVIAAGIVAQLRGEPAPQPPERTLRVRLIGGQHPVELHAALDADGHAVEAGLVEEAVEPASATAPPGAKVFGRHLTSYLAARAPADAVTR